MSLLLTIDVPGQTQRFSSANSGIVQLGTSTNQHVYHPIIIGTGVMQQELGPPLVPQLTFPTYTVDLDAPPRTIHVGAAATLRQGEGEGPYRTFFSGKVAQVLQQGANQTRLILRSQVEEKSGVYTQATATDLATIAAALATEGGFSNNFTTWAAESDNPDGTIEQTLPTPLGQLIAQAAFEGFYTAYVEGDKITGVPMAPEAPASLLAFPEPLHRRRGRAIELDYEILHDPFQEHITRLNLRVGRDVRVYEDTNHAAEATRGREILLDLKFIGADYMNVWAERFLDRHNTEPIYLRGTFPGVFLVGDQRYADFRQGSLSGGQFEHVNGNTNRYQVVQAVYDPQANTTRVLAKKIVAPPAFSSTGLTPEDSYTIPASGAGVEEVFSQNVDITTANVFVDTGYDLPSSYATDLWIVQLGSRIAPCSLFYGSEIHGGTVGGAAAGFLSMDFTSRAGGAVDVVVYFAQNNRNLLMAASNVTRGDATPLRIWRLQTGSGSGGGGTTTSSTGGGTMTWNNDGVRSFAARQGITSFSHVLGSATTTLSDQAITYTLVGSPTWMTFTAATRTVSRASAVPAPVDAPIVMLYSASDGTSTIYQTILVQITSTPETPPVLVGTNVPTNVVLTTPRGGTVQVVWTANSNYRTRIQWGPNASFVVIGEALLSKGLARFDITGLEAALELQVRVAFVDDTGTAGNYYEIGAISWDFDVSTLVTVIISKSRGTTPPFVLPSATTTQRGASVTYSHGTIPPQLTAIGVSLNLNTRTITIPSAGFNRLTAPASYTMTWSATDGTNTITRNIRFRIDP